MSIDRVSGTAKVYLRVLFDGDFPESGIKLATPNSLSIIHCEEFLPGGSTVLKIGNADEPYIVSELDWSQHNVFVEQDLGWEFTLRASPVRILLVGAGEGLPDLVEVNQIPRSEPFYIIYRHELGSQVDAWAKENCDSFSALTMSSGIPIVW